MCVYDMTNEKSFENLEKYWLKEIKQHAPPNAVLMLVGNKADMDQERKVSHSDFWYLGDLSFDGHLAREHIYSKHIPRVAVFWSGGNIGIRCDA